MSEKYGYLKKYHFSNYGDRIEWPNNVIYDISQDEIIEAERLMGIELPSQLKEFYQEIGAGEITVPHIRPENYDFVGANKILSPLAVAHFYLGIKAFREEPFEDAIFYEEDYLANSVLDMLEPGDLPFFEISDSSSFLVMKTQSDNPNAVWSDTGIKIEDSFERFIYRLYYEDPGYYGNVIYDHYGIPRLD